jgi:two-component system NarL family response regulator
LVEETAENLISDPAENSATAPAQIRVLIVDDHAAMREGLRAMIDHQPDMAVVAEGANGQEAITLYRQRRPDVTLMDVSLPLLSGVEATRKIRDEFPDARIIVVTTYDDDDILFGAFDAGVMGFLLKDLLRKELLPAIRAVHNNQEYFTPAIAARLPNRLPGR